MRCVVLLVLCITACGAGSEPEFISPCGVRVFADDSRGYTEIESSMLEAVAVEVPDIDPTVLCKRMKGWSVDIYAGSNGQNWEDPYGRGKIGGWTLCPRRLMQVANSTWRTNALPHEMLHAYDLCATPNHEGWEESGRNRATSRVWNK